MPVNRLLDSLIPLRLADRLLTSSKAISMLCGILPHRLLESSACNLYRTEFLQKHSFTTEFGHCGDTAWGVKTSPLARISFTTRSCDQFCCQTSFRAEDPQKQLSRPRQLAELARSSLSACATHDPEVVVMLGWFNANDYSTQVLWNWMGEQHSYQDHLQSKYEGGIVQYLQRVLRDEWKILRKGKA